MGNFCSHSCTPFSLGKFWGKSMKNGVSGEFEFETTINTLVAKTYDEESLVGGVSKIVFMRYMYADYPELSGGIFNYTAGSTIHTYPSPQFVDKERFTLNVNILLRESSPEEQLYCYVSFFTLNGDVLNRKRFTEFMKLVYDVSLTKHPEKACLEAENTIDCVVEAVFREAETLSIERVLEWIDFNCPRIVGMLHTYVVNEFKWNDLSTDWKSYLRLSMQSINMPMDTEETFGSLKTSQLWILSTTLPDLYTRPFDDLKTQIFSTRASTTSVTGVRRKSVTSHSTRGNFVSPYSLTVPDPFLSHWKPLYDSNQHGCSLNRLSFYVFDYAGPTALVLTCKDNLIFCVCVGVQWRQSDTHWGDSFSHLIQLSPLYCLIDKGARMMYMNVSIHGHPHGLQIGTNTKSPLLVVNESLTDLRYRDVRYPLETIEVWGCGSKKIYESYDIEQQHRTTLPTERDGLGDKYLLSLTRRPSSHEF